MKSFSPIGMAKPTPTLPPLPLGSAIAVLIPISLPLLSSSTPPEFPGLIAASVWMMPRSVVPLEAYDPSLGDASSRPRPEMIPVDIEWSSPKGFPRAYVFCPTCRPADEPSVTGFVTTMPSRFQMKPEPVPRGTRVASIEP